MKESLYVPHSRPWIIDEDCASVHAVMQSGMLARGELSRTFEKEVAAYNGCKGGVSFPSGTSALVFALKHLNVGSGSEVILPTYVCSSVLKAVQLVGAMPVLCDIGEETWNMTPKSVKPLLTSNTGAIIAVHIFGIPCDVEGLKEFGIPVIEDCAQAFGAKCSGKNVGSIGELGIYSFHATKCLTTGEGGMVVTGDAKMLAHLQEVRKSFQEITYPLSDLQAALGLSQLRRYDKFLEKRAALASVYFDSLTGDVTGQLRKQRNESIFFRFPLYGDFDFEVLVKKMAQHGIQVRKGVDFLLHRALGLDDDKYPNAVRAIRKTVSLPISPSTDEQEIRYVCTVLEKILS